jgi:uncharacterized membrane protein YtjA (UPF0391 family)
VQLLVTGAFGISSGTIPRINKWIAVSGDEVGPRQAALIALARHLPFKGSKEETAMLYYALVFLIVGLIAGALGLFGIAAMASQISWILFLIGIVLLVVHLATGRGTRVL